MPFTPINSPPLFSLLAIGALALVASWCAAHLARWLAPRIGMMDYPDSRRKRHTAPTPLLGGLALVAGMATAWAIVRRGPPELVPYALSGFAIFLTGVVDDMQPLRARVKLACQFVAILPLLAGVPHATRIELLGWTLGIPGIGMVATAVWILAITNMVNLLDGADGVAATFGVICGLALTVVTFHAGQPHLPLLCAATVGSLLGFLLHNWPPAKIFLGDGGSLLLGYLLAITSLEAGVGSGGIWRPLPFLLLFAIPCIDTCMAVLRRWLQNRSVGVGDHGHIHHVLRRQGLSVQRTVLVLAGLALFSGIAMQLALVTQSDLLAVASMSTLAGGLIATKTFGFSEVNALWQAMRHRSAALTISATPDDMGTSKRAARAPLRLRAVHQLLDRGERNTPEHPVRAA